MATQIKTLAGTAASSPSTATSSPSRPSSRMPAWLKSPELTAAMEATEESFQNRVEPILQATPEQLEQLTRRCLQQGALLHR